MKYKKYWKIILSLAALLLLSVFFISNIEITKPENNTVAGNIIADNEADSEDDSEEISSKDIKDSPFEEAEKQEEAAKESTVNDTKPEEKKAEVKSESTAPDAGSTTNNKTVYEAKNTSNAQVQAEQGKEYYSFSIDCYTVLDNMNNLKKGKEGCLGSNGLIFSGQVEGKEGMSVKELLINTCNNNNIKVYNKGDYITGINGLMEKDCGKLSGWMYSVNGVFPMKSVGDYKIKKGDVIKFRYTCNNCGKDLM